MLDGISAYPNVSVMAATNFPWKLDSAILRRFTKKVMIDLPDQKAIGKIIELNIDKYIRLVAKDFLDVAPEPKDTKRRQQVPECQSKCGTQTKKQPAEDADKACLERNKGKSLMERYKEYLRITPKEIQAVAAELFKKLYSASDVNRVTSQALINAGERARNHGSFFKLTADQIRDKDCVEIKGGIYMSTLSLPDSMIKNLSKDNISMLEVPRVREIKFKPQGQDEMTFLNVKFHVGNIAKYVADDTIKDIYVAPETYKDGQDIHVLFPLPIRVSIDAGQEITTELWVYSFYDYKKVLAKKEGWGNTFRQGIHYFKSFWSFEGGVPKEFDGPGITNPKVVRQIVSMEPLKKTDSREYGGWQLKTPSIPATQTLFRTLLEKQTLDLDEIRKVVATEQSAAFDTAVKRFSETKNLVQLLVGLLKINSVSVDLALQSYDQISTKATFEETTDADRNKYVIEDKARILSFDIRQEDFINAMGEIQSTAKKSELAELRKYRKDPSGYKPS
jgi:SpoVK/Ycf46/Vps4 family AAA+-type ATPase